MAIAVAYEGQTFNRWTQYCFARVLAEKHGFELATQWTHPEFIGVAPPKPGKAYREVAALVSGFYQHAAWIHENEKLIRGFAKPMDVESVSPNDVAIHVRRGDYQKWRLIPAQWYLDILGTLKFEHLFVVGDGLEKEFLDKIFSRHKTAQLMNGSAVSDWNFLRRFNKLVLSNSSYSFWAAFFSRASEVYVHDPWFSAIGSRGEKGDEHVTLHEYPGWIKKPGLFEEARHEGI